MRYPTNEHYGASEGVTGSCHQLRMDATSSLLVDCGLFQGSETSSGGRASAGQLAVEFALQTVKALVVTHGISTMSGGFPICWPGLGVASRGEGLLQTTAKGNLKSDGINCKQ